MQKSTCVSFKNYLSVTFTSRDQLKLISVL